MFHPILRLTAEPAALRCAVRGKKPDPHCSGPSVDPQRQGGHHHSCRQVPDGTNDPAHCQYCPVWIPSLNFFTYPGYPPDFLQGCAQAAHQACFQPPNPVCPQRMHHGRARVAPSDCRSWFSHHPCCSHAWHGTPRIGPRICHIIVIISRVSLYMPDVQTPAQIFQAEPQLTNPKSQDWFSCRWRSPRGNSHPIR
jgi:hypothetical protein